MCKGKLTIYCGTGRGKSSAAIGNAVFAAEAGKSVIIIQFLKSKAKSSVSLLERLEPEIKLFRFERSECEYGELSEEEREEEKKNIKNGLGYARKVLGTGECDMLVLDEIMGLLDMGIVDGKDLKEIFDAAHSDVEIVLTGRRLDERIAKKADEVYFIEPGEKEKKKDKNNKNDKSRKN